MKKVIDLSHNLVHSMSTHPYDDEVKLYQDKYLDEDHYVNFKLEIGMHAGTHIDAPMHLVKSDQFINEFLLERFVGNGVLLDVRGENEIQYKPEYEKMISKGDIVLLLTGHSKKFGDESYYTDYPTIDKKLAKFFVKKKIKMLGLDLPSPDHYPFDIHKLLFKKEIFIIENLTNLEELLDINSFEVIAFPLKVKAEASIARVVAREIEEFKLTISG
ncbi:cyclase family protein [Haloplasma contractile]|uniref:Cyclase-related protein n=1 Tax=Haloplasma contractile SSD-17B TaxID=1033810 RepID=U2DSW7_9MOLU|nr:cyclase family protein [Haloplasma contractile]ERJ11587.1 Cyclase-related protein [Haloplasma contractile SSD-17B]